MTFDTWRQDAVAHYAALARLPVPHAAATARSLAEAAEAAAEGFLAGLVEEVRAELANEGGDAAR